MIIELMVVGAVLGAGGLLVSVTKDAEADIKKWEPAIRSMSLPSKPKIELSDAGELIVELIKTGEGWVRSKPSDRRVQYSHEGTGTVLDILNLLRGGVSIHAKLDNSGVDNEIDLNEADKDAIYEELQAYKARERDRKQRELKKSLAERILAAERGEVRPVLGDHRVRPAYESNESVAVGSVSVDKIRATTPGLLTYDKARQQIVTIGNRDKLQLSDYLRQRYDMLMYDTAQSLYETESYDD